MQARLILGLARLEDTLRSRRRALTIPLVVVATLPFVGYDLLISALMLALIAFIYGLPNLIKQVQWQIERFARYLRGPEGPPPYKEVYKGYAYMGLLAAAFGGLFFLPLGFFTGSRSWMNAGAALVCLFFFTAQMIAPMNKRERIFCTVIATLTSVALFAGVNLAFPWLAPPE